MAQNHIALHKLGQISFPQRLCWWLWPSSRRVTASTQGLYLLVYGNHRAAHLAIPGQDSRLLAMQSPRVHHWPLPSLECP